MTAKMSMFLSELAVLLDRYGAELSYSTDDDGLYADIGNEGVCFGFPPPGGATLHMTGIIENRCMFKDAPPPNAEGQGCRASRHTLDPLVGASGSPKES